jgi:tRNA U34 5-carboxymethylaminomethyl modifying GTPase MnmE/TrmE
MAAFHLQLCADAVGEIAGTIVHEQVLDSLFSQFCIGK